jgi:tetratricopeptide (TPR) repeat protein
MVQWAAFLECGKDSMRRKARKEPPLKSALAGQEEISRPAGRPPQGTGTAWFSVAVLVAAVLVSYANSLRCPFIFDDSNDIVGNPTIRRLWPLGDVFLVRSQNAVGLQSRPVANLSFALDYAVGGLNTLPYHVTSLAIHILAGLALFGVVRRTLLLPQFRDRFGRASVPLALAVALLWALHPLQTESVTYITQRYESLMALFYLVAVYGVIRCSYSPLPPGEGQGVGAGGPAHPYLWGAVTAAAALLSLGSKEVAISLPIMILLYDRLLLSGSFSEIRRRRWGMYVALLAVWAAFAVLQFLAGPRPWAGYALPVSWFEYARSQPGVVLHYLRLVFWPQPLVLDYGWRPAQAIAEILPGAMVVAALLAATGYALWRWPAWGLLGAWFFLVLAPTSSVMPLNDLAVEHRMYLPLAAVAVAVVFAAYAAAGALVLSARRRAMVLRCLLGSVAAALAILTWQRNNDYRDGLLLWQDVVARRPNHPRARNSLGNALADRGKLDDAIAQFRQALEIAPGYAVAHYNLGNALARRGRPVDVVEAIAHYQDALQFKPDYAEAHSNLGEVLAGRGEAKDAIAHYRQALQIKPDYAEAHNNLANALAERGDVDDAIGHYRRALETKPDFAAAHNNLGCALAGRGQFDAAIAHYRQALEIEPDYAEAHFNLAEVLAGQGQFDEALVQYGQALKTKPAGTMYSWSAEAHYKLGYILAGRGQMNDAIAHYLKALAIKPDYAAVHNNLANALADRGHFDLAIIQYRAALEIEPNNLEAHFSFGNVLTARGSRDEALVHYEKALDLAAARNDPDLAGKIRAQIKLHLSAAPAGNVP